LNLRKKSVSALSGSLCIWIQS